MKRERLNALFTARTDRLPCTIGYAYVVKLCKLLNQKLTIQATENSERYSRSTIFNVLEGQMERSVASIVCFLRNSPLSSKPVHTSRLFASVKLQQPTIVKNGSVRPCIVHRTVCWQLGLFGSIDTECYFCLKKKDNQQH